MKTVLLFLFTLIFLISCKEKTLFQKIDAEDSGITFANRLTENDTLNILDFEYVYNGAGVGVADFNNDGMQDLFFSGNQVANKLYLNKGDFKFEDASKFAQIDGNGKWCAGVVTVDINSDGLMDVYVAATVNQPDTKRENLLYVNQGINNGKPKFKEMAAEYGINDNGHSENAAFFDYDNDGDLDLYVLTNIIDQNPNQFRVKKIDGSNPNTDRLYRCDYNEKLGHSFYTNVSKDTGITIEGYGLGLNICDINKDGFKDIYVTNDYISDDLFYINNGKGKFKDYAQKLLKHTSSSAMGNDIADINNDGNLDIFAVDMLAKSNLRKKVLTGPFNYQTYNFNAEYGFNHQYMRNTLQLNNGINGKENMPMFSEISLLAGTAETDWSWTPSLADFDNDGERDLIITNGFPKDITDRDFAAFRNETENLAERSYILEQIPVLKISNYAFKNNGNLQFENVTEKWGMNIPSFSNGAVYADLDNDGDLDYVVNNINDSAFVYKNNLIDGKNHESEKPTHYLRIKCKGDKQNINGIGAVAILEFDNGEKTIHENNPFRGYLSSVEPFIHFGLGAKKIKSLEIQWYNGMSEFFKNPKIDQVLEVNIKNANVKTNNNTEVKSQFFTDITNEIKIDYIHAETDYIDFNVQNLMPFKLSELGPGMCVGDINADGLDDVFIGGSKDMIGLFFIQQANGQYLKKYLTNGSNINLKKGEDLGSLLFDADNDNDLDLYICRGGTEGTVSDSLFYDSFYVNDGKGNFLESKNAIPQFNTSTSCVRAADYDNDGDLDLFVAGRNIPGQYPKFADSYIFRNDSKNKVAKFSEVKLTAFKNLGLVCDMLWTDFDNDGWIDILIASEWASPKFFKNKKGQFEEITKTGLENLNGLWSSINGGDFDNDGDIDYMMGNLGLNTMLKGTKEEPVKLLAKDFDNNGNYDLIPFVYYLATDNKRKLVPFNGKDDVNKQLIATKKRFVSYKEFANADFENLLTKEEKQDCQELTLDFTESIIVENLGNGNFAVKTLPAEVQFSPINGITIEDFNNDGFQDILVAGNNHANETSMGRYDAANGTLLIGNGKCEFKVGNNSGYYVPKDAKSSITVANNKGELLVFTAQNKNLLRVFKSKISKQIMEVAKNAKYYSFDINGKKTKRELYYGSSYLAQSGRYITIPSRAKNLKIY
jgi:enediyne biosynthesis protein E4